MNVSDAPNLDETLIRRLPKVALHEHLDGCVRPATLLELATQSGYSELPESNPEALGRWFVRGADRGSLPLYLEGFQHTIALLQTGEALERVAYEYLEDLAADGVVYGEVRFAPHFHTSGDGRSAALGLDGVMHAVLRGLERGSRDFGVGFGLIVCAMRNESEDLSIKLAELALAYREQGCVGFDLAGEEAGHPANEHLRAFQAAGPLLDLGPVDVHQQGGRAVGPPGPVPGRGEGIRAQGLGLGHRRAGGQQEHDGQDRGEAPAAREPRRGSMGCAHGAESRQAGAGAV